MSYLRKSKPPFAATEREEKPDAPIKTKKKEIPFAVKRWLMRNMAGCKKATGFTAAQIYEMLEL